MKFFNNVLVYTFVGFFGPGVNFLLMPVLSHYLSPSDYGIAVLLSTYVAFLAPLMSFMAHGLIPVSYFQITDKKEFASAFSSISFIPLLPTIVLFLLFWLSFNSLEGLLELPPHTKWWVLTIFPVSLMATISDTTVYYLINANRTKVFAIYNIMKTVVEVGLTLLFVIHLHMGWKGRILAGLISMVVFSLFSLVYFRYRGLLTTDIRWTYIRQGLLFGAPLILHTIGKVFVHQADRLFISKMISVSEAGVYSVGYTIGTVVMIAGTALANVVSPRIMANLENPGPQEQKYIRRITYAAIGGLAVLVLIMSLTGPLFFRYFMDARYAAGSQYVSWVSLAFLFYDIFIIFSPAVYFYKKNGLFARLAIISIINNFIFNYVLIKYCGAIGAAYATALSFFISMSLLVIRVYRMLPWMRFQLADFRREQHS